MVSIETGSKSERIELIATRRVLPTGRKQAWLLSEAARSDSNSSELFCMPHHWEDPKKKTADYEYLDELHARVLTGLGQALNSRHKVKWSDKAWDSLVGYWLMRALSCLLDQWETVRQAAESGHSFDLLVSSLTESNITPMNTGEALNWFNADWWKEVVLLQIARQFAAFQAVQTEPVSTALDRGPSVQSLARNSLESLKKVAGRITRRSSQTSQADLFLVETGLPQNLMDEILEVGDGRVGRPHFPTLFRYPNGKSPRTWRPEWDGLGSDFERWLQLILPEILPTAYVENFSYLHKHYTRPVPKNPFTVITKSAHFQNEGFKFWFSGHLDIGRLAVIHHGGGPIWEMNTSERWERSLSDCYLTSGPADEPRWEKVKSVGKLTNKISGEWSPSGDLLLVTTLIKRNSQSGVYGAPLPSQMPRVFDDQANLVNALPAEIRKDVRVRMYPKGSGGWDQKAEWKKRVPDVVFGPERQPFEQAVAASRIVVVPYRGSTYIQTLHANVPTIIFFSPLWPLEESSREFYVMLSDVGIFHSDAVTATKKIVEVWPNVGKWWSSRPVQDAVGAWNAAYAETYHDPVGRILEQVNFFEDSLQSRPGAN